MAPLTQAKCQGAQVLKGYDKDLAEVQASERVHFSDFSTALAATWRTHPVPMEPSFSSAWAIQGIGK
jgi:hypothetical protein